MGWGDEVMVTAAARRLQQSDPRPVAVRHRFGSARWHPIWDGNPRLARPEEVRGADDADVQWLENHGGARPYIDYTRSRPGERWRFQPWGCVPGEIYLTAEELLPFRWLQGKVLVEPNLKPGAPPNKDWGYIRWQQLVHALPHVPWVQIGAPGARRLAGVKFVPTANVREASAAVSQVRAAVLPEGGLHHAAAAFGVPAVVLFGGYISPAITGYAMHRNLYTGGAEYPFGCGQRHRCEHCAQAMARIGVRDVITELEAALETDRRSVAA